MEEMTYIDRSRASRDLQSAISQTGNWKSARLCVY